MLDPRYIDAHPGLASGDVAGAPDHPILQPSDAGNKAAPPPSDSPADPPRALLTLHLPLDMLLVGRVLEFTAIAYPDAVLGDDGVVYDRPAAPSEEASS